MSSDREIMQRALEAMLESREVGPYADDDCLSEAITALRERLSRCDRCGKPSGEAGHIHTCSPQVTEPYCDDCGGTDPECPLKVEHTKKYVTEPVAVVKTLSMGEGKPPFHYIECRHLPEGTPLYTPPQRRKWMGLTDEEADELIRRFARYELLRAIEQVLKEKNTCPT